jgi:epoxide hydrolase 4
VEALGTGRAIGGAVERLSHTTFQGPAGQIHTVELGRGPLVVLLHGFPEFWYGWREQIEPLADAGFRVVAPDLRGYNLSVRPEERSAYTIGSVSADLTALIAYLQPAGGAAVVGHDWGALLAWYLASSEPRLVGRLAALSVPHPRAVSRGMRRPLQLARLSYQFFFQIPLIPEALLSAGDFAALRLLMKRFSKRPGAMTPEVVARYVGAWSHPGAVRAMLAYYRALRRRRGTPRAHASIAAPTLVIRGADDRLFDPDLYEMSSEFADDCTIRVVEGAGHFVQHDAPEEVNLILGEFLSPMLHG